MKKILRKQKLILIVFAVVFLQLLFSTNKNIFPAYGQSITQEIMHWYSNGGYFKGNGKEGGPECGKCYYYESAGGKCISKYSGITGNFTKDNACKEAYGSNAKEGKTLGKWGADGVYISFCIGDIVASAIDKVECIIPTTPTAPTNTVVYNPPPSPPCAQWQYPGPESGVCEEVATSLPSGNISTNPAQFIVKILAIILSFAGGIALLLIISAGYKIITSNGKAEGIQQGRDQLISAIIGLLFIIFSFVIFQLITSDILKIPGITK